MTEEKFTPVPQGLGNMIYRIELRDLFAISALQGIISLGLSYGNSSDETVAKLRAERAYQYADAMLEARKEVVSDPTDGST